MSKASLIADQWEAFPAFAGAMARIIMPRLSTIPPGYVPVPIGAIQNCERNLEMIEFKNDDEPYDERETNP